MKSVMICLSFALVLLLVFITETDATCKSCQKTCLDRRCTGNTCSIVTYGLEKKVRCQCLNCYGGHHLPAIISPYHPNNYLQCPTVKCNRVCKSRGCQWRRTCAKLHGVIKCHCENCHNIFYPGK